MKEEKFFSERNKSSYPIKIKLNVILEKMDSRAEGLLIRV